MARHRVPGGVKRVAGAKLGANILLVLHVSSGWGYLYGYVCVFEIEEARKTQEVVVNRDTAVT